MAERETTPGGKPELKRSLGLFLLTLYGLGTVVGAGIYAVIGEIAGHAGLYTPLAFLVAGVLALFSALSLSELSARYPKSAGEAVYVFEGFGLKWLSTLVGLLVVLSGIVSAATIVNGAVGYVRMLVEVEPHLVIIGFCLFLGGVAALGVGQSVGFAAVISVIEILGLMLVIGAGSGSLADIPRLYAEAPPLDSTLLVSGILGGALLAFYAFIGFEDMVNMAEEVKDPVRTLPKAILWVLVLSSVLYILLSLVLVGSMDMTLLRQSEAPLVTVFETTSGLHGGIVSIIGMLAILNGGLIQIIMGARVLYGLARQGSVPGALGVVSERTRTPVLATFVVTGIVLGLALLGTLSGLAALTSLMVLTVFTLVNLALVFVKRKGPPPEGAPNYPVLMPLLGALVSGGFVLWKLAGMV